MDDLIPAPGTLESVCTLHWPRHDVDERRWRRGRGGGERLSRPGGGVRGWPLEIVSEGGEERLGGRGGEGEGFRGKHKLEVFSSISV
jgi:hypothetical protein